MAGRKALEKFFIPFILNNFIKLGKKLIAGKSALVNYFCLTVEMKVFKKVILVILLHPQKSSFFNSPKLGLQTGKPETINYEPLPILLLHQPVRCFSRHPSWGTISNPEAKGKIISPIDGFTFFEWIGGYAGHYTGQFQAGH